MFSEYQIMFPIIFYMSKYLQSCVVHYTGVVPAIISKNLSLPSSLVLVQLLQPRGYRVEATPGTASEQPTWPLYKVLVIHLVNKNIVFVI